jgi:hypothetical protein
MSKINPKRIEEMFMSCLYKSEEISNGQLPEGAIITEGLQNKFGFHPERLSVCKEEILSYVNELKPDFLSSGGGGTSFLNLCEDKDGNQWTGMHSIMEQFFCLASGLGLAGFCLPRELWAALPGGMPYICFKDKED